MQRIFLHSGWRCGSTYLWSKFREHAAVTAFYEPFSEKLASYTTDEILKDVPDAWDSRHPRLNAPYAAEYLPLIAARGVPLYSERFAVERYFAGHDEPLQERDYLNSLLDCARNRTDYCVLGFSRSLGRVGALKAYFPGYHVVLMRDPVQQWMSCRSYRMEFGELYFELCHFLILALAPPGTLAARIAQSLRLPTPPAGSFKQQIRFMRRQFRRLDDELSYQVFLAVYVLSYLEALPEADLLIDMDCLGTSRSNEVVTRSIAGRTGLALDFSDYSLPTHPATGIDVDFARVHDEVLGWIRDSHRMTGSSSSVKTAAWYVVSEKLQNALHTCRPARFERRA